MSNPSNYPGANGPLIDVDDLRDAGVPVSDEIDYPTVGGDYVLDDDDEQVCRYATRDEIVPMYIDNAVQVSDVQADVWTLEIDQSEITFTYANGRSWTTTVGQLRGDGGGHAERYRKTGDLVFPSDAGGYTIINDTTCPRLVALYGWMHEQMRERSEQRLEIAEIVSAFAQIIGLHSQMPN
jgi:hypothetical protein